MRRVRVKPRKADLIVLDDLSRRIIYKEEGVEVNLTPLVSRLINKDKDLIIVDEKIAQKIIKEKASAKKKEEAELKKKLEEEAKAKAKAGSDDKKGDK